MDPYYNGAFEVSVAVARGGGHAGSVINISCETEYRMLEPLLVGHVLKTVSIV